MPETDLTFVLARLERIQKELGLMRLREEQSEASHQALTGTLSRQMVEIATSVEDRIAGVDDRLDRVEERLSQFGEQLGRMEGLLTRIAEG